MNIIFDQASLLSQLSVLPTFIYASLIDQK